MSQDKKLLKEIFEKLKENFEIITATLGFFVMCIDYIIKLIFSKQREIEYNIPSKYFFYFNYNQILLISLFIVILVITVLQSIYNKEKNQDNDSKIQGRKLQNFGCQVTVAYLLLIFNVYQLTFDNVYSIIWFILCILLSIVIFIMSVLYNFLKDKKCKLITILVIYVIELLVGIVISSLSLQSVHNYELTTVEGKNMIVLSEYEDKYLAVPYLLDGENYKSGNELKKCESKKYCLFTGSYQLIEKVGHEFESKIIKNNERQIYKIKFIKEEKK